MTIVLTKLRFFYIFLIAAIIVFQPLYASTILQVDTTYLVNKSELVFEGEVVSSRSEHVANGFIYTYVDFLLLDVLVGELDAGGTITLRFTGGTVGDLTLNVGSEIPVLGEHGIYFVERQGAKLINPLLGWSQGHFKIQNNKLIAGNGQVVVGVIKANSSSSIALSDGIAKGVMTSISSEINKADAGDMDVAPIAIDDFKRIIKTLKN